MFTGINVTEFGRRFQNQENCYRFLYSVIGVSFVAPHMTLRERPAFTGGVKVARLMIVWLLTLFFMDFECKSWRHFTYYFGLWQKIWLCLKSNCQLKSALSRRRVGNLSWKLKMPWYKKTADVISSSSGRRNHCWKIS